MPVQVFVDDSGGKGQTRHLVLAGLMAHADHWAAFSDAWRFRLAEDRPIAYFKMREAAGFSGQFHRFTPDQRDTKLRSLAGSINRFVQLATYSIIDLDAHQKTWAADHPKPLSEPYFFPFHNTIIASAFELSDLKWRERFDIIFDEQVIFGPRAKAWYPLVREVMQQREPEAHSIMPIDPLFRSDDEFLPLQAADLFAGCWRQSADEPDKEPPFGWVADEMPSITVSEYSQYYDLERLQSATDEARRQLREGLIPMDLVEKYRKELGGK